MPTPPPFLPLPPDDPQVVTWIHLGDLHMVRPGEGSFDDLRAIVAEINRAYAGKGVSFVYLPGDVADDGSVTAYNAVRSCLDALQVPWTAIVGDHDVHEKSYRNFQDAMDRALYSAFTVGRVRFFRLNCFSTPEPGSFSVDGEQLAWLERELAASDGERRVVLMHCYPSDLKEGGAALTELLHRFQVQLVDMGHTHYNEISNDGETLFSATRSTGQIEEGPAGYSVITLDGTDVSWQFRPVGSLPVVAITSPADDRLVPDARAERIAPSHPLPVRVRVWDEEDTDRVTLEVAGTTLPLTRQGSCSWHTTLPADLLSAGRHTLRVTAWGHGGARGSDAVQITAGARAAGTPQRATVDQDNALEAWPERGLLGTQLGPNKNGKKW